MNYMKEKFNLLLVIIVVIILILGILIILNIPKAPSSHSNVHLSAPSPNTTVVAFVSDAKPALGENINNLVNDFNQIKPQSPGNVTAIVAIGDMNPLELV